MSKYVSVELLELCKKMNVCHSNIPCIDSDEHDEQIRAEAIDEFAKALRSAIRDDTCGCSWDAKEIVARIAERLKGENV